MKDKDYSEACWKTKIGMQSRATEKHHDQIFEEMKKLEEKKSGEALPTCAGKVRFVEISERERRSKKAAENWKLQKAEEGGGLAGLSLPFSHAGHRRWITSKR